MGAFSPCFVFANEYAQYGLPTSADQPDIDNLVQLASSMIDEFCGRTDGDGNGSLVYSTYIQRLNLQSPGRNLAYLPIKPIVAVSAAKVASLQALDAASGGFYYTGVLPNTILQLNGSLSGIIACSGRYGYTRRDQSAQYPDMQSIVNPLNLITLFGGPAPWIGIDITNSDYDLKTGEIWLPAGLQLTRYSEILITYNSGYDPGNMPKQIKLATSALVKNLMAKGSGTTGIKSQSLGRAGFNVVMTEDIIDPNIERLLRSFVVVRAY